MMQSLAISAFVEGVDAAGAAIGGNGAGVAVMDAFPSDAVMQAEAARLGFSETVFAVASGAGYRVRYFAPEGEVPFCGHATIALGHVLAQAAGATNFQLTLNHGKICVARDAAGMIALQSLPTHSRLLTEGEAARYLALFGLRQVDLSSDLPAARGFAGAHHIIIPLASREGLAAMDYDFDVAQTLMRAEEITTIALVFAANRREFHVRNAFASGGVLEDPATGAAAAALGGYLRDQNWPHQGSIEIHQGVDMGPPSRIWVDIDPTHGAPITVRGFAAPMTAE